MKLTDEEKERIAIMVENLPDEQAQREYDRRCEMLAEMKARRENKKEKAK